MGSATTICTWRWTTIPDWPTGLLLGAHDPGQWRSDLYRGRGHRVHRSGTDAPATPPGSPGNPRHPFAVTPPREDTLRAHWIRPVLVGEVEYRQFTREDGRLRHTSWRGLRADREPADVLAPTAARPPDPQDTQPPLAQRVTVRVGDRQLYVEVLPDEKDPTCAGFLYRAVAWLRDQGVRVLRVLTDNAKVYRIGGCWRAV